MNIHIAVVNTKGQKILKEKAIKFIFSDSNGTETVLIGSVRNENSGKKAIAVTYDAHDQMVSKLFNSICDLTIKKFDMNAKIF
ncbi:MAG TPA: molybdenum cofactor biosynthesis protein MoaE [Desulfobacterales bacterium]|nr:molybdenum cofactor biosynthesis protein MoaE [Desulfobacterales bacterium]|tara:strand:+ start:465 stop:713 length:249 start_codon:yes stop_codon:yes gene_type:complete